MAFGLTDNGLEVPRAADLRQIFRDAYESATGLVIDWDRDTVLGPLSVVVAQRTGALSELLQAVYDGWDRNNAQGAQLDGLGLLIGVPRKGATRSTVTLTLTGTAGTVVPGGSQAQGGGADGRARWTIPDDTTIGGGGTVSVNAEAEDLGAVSATIGQISQVVQPVAGWTGVNNAADATLGEDIESDAAYRVRQQASLQATSGRSTGSLRSDLLAIDGVSSAVVVDNPTASAVTVSGVALDANSLAAILWPATMTTDTQEACILAIYESRPAGIKTMGTDVTADITVSPGIVVSIAFDFAAETSVDVDMTLDYETGYSSGDVTDAINAGLVTLFAGLPVGGAVRLLDIYGILAAIEGIDGVTTLTLNGVAADITPDNAHIATLGTVVVA